MKKFLLIILLVFLTSCSVSVFNTSSISLNQEIKYYLDDNNKIAKRESCLLFSFIADKDSQYSITLISPSNLKWTSDCVKKDIKYESEKLYISTNALHEAGDYKYYIVNDELSEVSSIISLEKESADPTIFSPSNLDESISYTIEEYENSRLINTTVYNDNFTLNENTEYIYLIEHKKNGNKIITIQNV